NRVCSKYSSDGQLL
ncbi:hypothetical protein TYRP_004936, partial [Tyrophagus putrescentiae]